MLPRLHCNSRLNNGGMLCKHFEGLWPHNVPNYPYVALSHITLFSFTSLTWRYGSTFVVDKNRLNSIMIRERVFGPRHLGHCYACAFATPSVIKWSVENIVYAFAILWSSKLLLNTLRRRKHVLASLTCIAITTRLKIWDQRNTMIHTPHILYAWITRRHRDVCMIPVLHTR